MRYNGTASPEELAIMSQGFEEFCKLYGITSDLERERVSELVISVFSIGAKTPDDIIAAVESRMAQAFRRQA